MATHNERYRAKQAYQLCLMRGISASDNCRVDFAANVVYVDGKAIRIAKAWLSL